MRQSPFAEADKKEALATRAEALREQAKERHDLPDFGGLARDNSEHRSSRYSGGDVGWISRSATATEWPTQVMDAMFSLRETGEISPVIRASDGIYLLKLIERQDSHPLPFDQVRSRIEYELTRERADKAEAEFYAQLKSNYPVQINTQRLAEIAQPIAATASRPPQLPAR
ncbi:MAG: peptidylprolyl isomerase [Limisphaerales bacterium]